MQSQILSAHPNAKLKVYAIWANKLFGPDATWDAHPGPLLADGGPVDAEIDTLKQAVEPLLS